MFRPWRLLCLRNRVETLHAKAALLLQFQNTLEKSCAQNEQQALWLF